MSKNPTQILIYCHRTDVSMWCNLQKYTFNCKMYVITIFSVMAYNLLAFLVRTRHASSVLVWLIKSHSQQLLNLISTKSRKNVKLPAGPFWETDWSIYNHQLSLTVACHFWLQSENSFLFFFKLVYVVWIIQFTNHTFSLSFILVMCNKLLHYSLPQNRYSTEIQYFLI